MVRESSAQLGNAQLLKTRRLSPADVSWLCRTRLPAQNASSKQADMSGKTLFKQMYAALEKSVTSSHQTHLKEILKKQDALIHYKRMQYMNAGKKLSADEDARLADEVRERFASKLPALDVHLLAHLDQEQLHRAEAEHLQNITTFLDSQREYIELLERYNPGISMKQTDKVRKTARRVGLEVPE